MDRRQALKNVAYMFAGAVSYATIDHIFSPNSFFDHKDSFSFSNYENDVLSEFAEIIIPTTSSSAGAKDAGVGEVIALIIKDCFPPESQLLFSNGLKAMLDKSNKQFDKDFLELTTKEKNLLVEDLKKEAITNLKAPCFFIIARDLTILGYFSSEIGCTKAREYLPIPGSYNGNVDYKPTQKAWAI